jgi:hypothetical protein
VFRQELYSLVTQISGFRKCTRLDAQITVLNPEVDALALLGMVERQEVWPLGYGRGQAYCERSHGGQIVGPVTQYFGATDSDRRARVYDKAGEQGWDVPAVRFEVQLRGAHASGTFAELARRCKADRYDGMMLVTAENGLVRDVVGTGLDFRDTTRWADGERPKNWAQFAPTPAWWEAVLGKHVDPIALQYERPVDLSATLEAALDQYGRKVALEVLRMAVVSDGDMDQVLRGVFLRAAARWRRDDLEILRGVLPAEDHEQLEKLYRVMTNAAARVSEGAP